MLKGSFKNSIGVTTGVVLRGKSILKSKSDPTNPNTLAQRVARRDFSTLLKFFSPFAEFSRRYICSYNNKISPYNQLVKNNTGRFYIFSQDSTQKVIQLTKGTLPRVVLSNFNSDSVVLYYEDQPEGELYTITLQLTNVSPVIASVFKTKSLKFCVTLVFFDSPEKNCISDAINIVQSTSEFDSTYIGTDTNDTSLVTFEISVPNVHVSDSTSCFCALFYYDYMQGRPKTSDSVIIPLELISGQDIPVPLPYSLFSDLWTTLEVDPTFIDNAGYSSSIELPRFIWNFNKLRVYDAPFRPSELPLLSMTCGLANSMQLLPSTVSAPFVAFDSFDFTVASDQQYIYCSKYSESQYRFISIVDHHYDNHTLVRGCIRTVGDSIVLNSQFVSDISMFIDNIVSDTQYDPDIAAWISINYYPDITMDISYDHYADNFFAFSLYHKGNDITVSTTTWFSAFIDNTVDGDWFYFCENIYFFNSINYDGYSYVYNKDLLLRRTEFTYYIYKDLLLQKSFAPSPNFADTVRLSFAGLLPFYIVDNNGAPAPYTSYIQECSRNSYTSYNEYSYIWHIEKKVYIDPAFLSFSDDNYAFRCFSICFYFSDDSCTKDSFIMDDRYPYYDITGSGSFFKYYNKDTSILSFDLCVGKSRIQSVSSVVLNFFSTVYTTSDYKTFDYSALCSFVYQIKFID